MQSRDLRFLAASLVALSILSTFASCQNSGAAIVRVGRETISEGDLEALARVNPKLKPKLATPAGRQKVIENYVDQEMLYQESINRGLNRSVGVKEKVALYEKILIAQALLEDELNKKIREYYDTHKNEFERVKIADILIRASSPDEPKPATPPAKNDKKKAPAPVVSKRSETEALKLAESIRDRINKGEDFSALAKELSEDDKSKAKGGVLGYVTLTDKKLDRLGWLPLAEKAFSMKEQEVSEPIKLKDGFHIIKVLGEKNLEAFEQAEAGIKFRIQADIRTGLLDNLKKKYKVEYVKVETKKDPAGPETNSSEGSAAPETTPAAPETTPTNPGEE